MQSSVSAVRFVNSGFSGAHDIGFRVGVAGFRVCG